jgi:hypothetical protein
MQILSEAKGAQILPQFPFETPRKFEQFSHMTAEWKFDIARTNLGTHGVCGCIEPGDIERITGNGHFTERCGVRPLPVGYYLLFRMNDECVPVCEENGVYQIRFALRQLETMQEESSYEFNYLLGEDFHPDHDDEDKEISIGSPDLKVLCPAKQIAISMGFLAVLRMVIAIITVRRRRRGTIPLTREINKQ